MEGTLPVYRLDTTGRPARGAVPMGSVLIVRSGFAAGPTKGSCEATEIAYARRQHPLVDVAQRVAMLTGEATRLITSLRV